jgi:hypothetical protein
MYSTNVRDSLNSDFDTLLKSNLKFSYHLELANKSPLFEKEICDEFNVKNANWGRIPIFIPKDFIRHSIEYFDNVVISPGIADAYYNKFTRLWGFYVQLGMWDASESIWTIILSITRKIEQSVGPIHKGTLFYFAAASAIFSGNIDKGFVLMHRALEEDKRSRGPNYSDCPSCHFVKMDSTHLNQFLLSDVRQSSKLLEYDLSEYKKRGYPSFTYNDFYLKFLDRPLLEEIVFSFVHCYYRIRNLTDHNLILIEPCNFSALLEMQMLANICLIVDSVIPSYYNITANNNDWKMHYRITQMIQILNMQNRNNWLSDIKTKFNNNISRTIQNLIMEKFQYNDGSLATAYECDLGLAYCLRNYSAHNVRAQVTIHENYPEIVGCVMNALFFVIQNAKKNP